MLRCEEVFAGIERGLKQSKLFLDCVLIVTSVVRPELLMELPLSVNMFLVALSKFGVYPAPCVGVLGVRLTVPPPRSYLLHRVVSHPVCRARRRVLLRKDEDHHQSLVVEGVAGVE